MELVTPGLGLVFWMVISFSVILFILKKFAWKPILKALKDREITIDTALKSADRAKEEMEQLKVDNEKIIKEAKNERDNLLKDARQVKDKIISEAKQKANSEAKKIITGAKVKIESEKEAALDEIKNQVAGFSIEIAEKILKKKLDKTKDQKDLIDELIDEIRIN
ncbi:MAG: F0F1 ATP synthase subunit B [Bacteroidales bacterium]|nr:F0F1 ATP synthase subunit B [Bacteroidales bacterium]